MTPQPSETVCFEIHSVPVPRRSAIASGLGSDQIAFGTTQGKGEWFCLALYSEDITNNLYL